MSDTVTQQIRIHSSPPTPAIQRLPVIADAPFSGPGSFWIKTTRKGTARLARCGLVNHLPQCRPSLHHACIITPTALYRVQQSTDRGVSMSLSRSHYSAGRQACACYCVCAVLRSPVPPS